MKEKLSALIDAEVNEFDERRILNALRDDAELRRTWERYHLIRSAATRQVGALLAPGFAERVLARLDAEGQTVAPGLRFWPLAGGFAAAAALVGVVAFFGLQVFRTPADAVAPLAVAPTVNETTPAATEATSLVARESPPTAAVSTTTAPASDASDERLSIYVVGHNEFMPTGSMGSMLPYVRVVTQRPDADPAAR